MVELIHDYSAAIQAIQALPEMERRIVQWTMVDGMDLQDAADNLGITAPYACRIRQRAFASIRSMMEDSHA
jgi:DNA-directed RNA polymerase specialized sigma subunit